MQKGRRRSKPAAGRRYYNKGGLPVGWLISGIIAAVLAGLLSCKVRVSLSCHETVTCRVTLAGIRIFSIPAPEKKRRKQERTEEKPEGKKSN